TTYPAARAILPLRGCAQQRHAPRALSIHAIGADIELGKDHVVLDAVVVDETDLDNVTVVHAQRRVDYALDVAADADERHLALGELGAEPIADVGGIFRLRALLGKLRLTR